MATAAAAAVVLLEMCAWPSCIQPRLCQHLRSALLPPPLQFGPTYEATRSSGLKHTVPALDLGLGCAFELDTAELQPQVGRVWGGAGAERRGGGWCGAGSRQGGWVHTQGRCMVRSPARIAQPHTPHACCPSSQQAVQARLKVRDLITLRALPYPALKISKRLGIKGDSSWGVRLRCALRRQRLPAPAPELCQGLRTARMAAWLGALA